MRASRCTMQLRAAPCAYTIYTLVKLSLFFAREDVIVNPPVVNHDHPYIYIYTPTLRG